MSSPANTTTETGSELVIVALGANLDSPVGAPADTLQAVLADLQGLAEAPLRTSSFYHTSPENCPPDSPRFVNAVTLMQLPASTEPLQFLNQLQDLEQCYGRQRKAALPVNAPRPLDLDIIAFGDRQLQHERLQLPHPRAAERAFVLEPLAELLPDYRLPGMTVSVRRLLETSRS
ncbi:MAG: 2-amino-4-hydroxy-6-hydroxymethyldihydropteridine diphosphokinase [Pseudomonadales bacterium]|jgi:2-amino-4-hydroxy-6-hydroxymethyldihydropteridine diphosphokinase|nr:2-amino-4-hydroxy-6-hydroxymethyldihydropteridine diphosphokinase [Pseudomonadales bacterium]